MEGRRRIAAFRIPGQIPGKFPARAAVENRCIPGLTWPEEHEIRRHMEPHDTNAAELPGGRIGPREGIILTAIVERYIANGDPVASQTIARQQNREGMSSATVRNVMANLAESGYLEQPHTSAGRIPTAHAFRYYVEQLLRCMATSSSGLPQPTQAQIEDTFHGVATATDFFSRTSHILALVSGGVGVALTAIGEHELLEHVHFVRLGQAKVLTVLVTTSGVVRDRLLELDRDLTAADLEMAANYLNANFHGWNLERIRQELARRIEQERNEYDRILRSMEELWAKCAMDRSVPEKSVFVDGVANLIVNEADHQRLRQVFVALEEKQRIIDLLNAYVDSSNPSVRVVVGLQDAMPELRDLVLVAAPVRRGQDHSGTVAVIGPTRMQYASTIGTVTYIANLFNRWAVQS